MSSATAVLRFLGLAAAVSACANQRVPPSSDFHGSFDHDWPPNCSEPLDPASPWLLLDSGTTENLFAVGARSASDVYVVGANTFIHYSGTRWEPVADFGSRYLLRDVWVGATSAYAVGDMGVVLHNNGGEWKQRGAGLADLRQVWATGSENAFVAAYSGELFRYDGTRWSQMDSPASSQTVIAGSGVDHVYVLGGGPANAAPGLYRLAGREWELATPMADCSLAMWANPTGEVYVAASSTSDMFVYSGQVLRRVGRGTSYRIHAIWGSSARSVYAVGERGVIVHYDGVKWSRMNSGTRFALNDITGTPDGRVFAVGECGKILMMSDD